MNDGPGVMSREDILQRIRGEYLEMPGLRLTRAQAVRLWSLEPPLCGELLDALAAEGFLRRRADGTYGRRTDGAPVFPAPQMAKADAAVNRAAHYRRRMA